MMRAATRVMRLSIIRTPDATCRKSAAFCRYRALQPSERHGKTCPRLPRLDHATMPPPPLPFTPLRLPMPIATSACATPSARGCADTTMSFAAAVVIYYAAAHTRER